MILEEVLHLLGQKNNPLLDRFDQPPFDPTKPLLRFRGGESGKFHSSLKKIDGKIFYSGNWNLQRTLVAYNLSDALLYSLTRSDRESKEPLHQTSRRGILLNRGGKGGRYDPTTGELLANFRYGFPFLIAINISPYVPNKIDKIGFLPGEIHITAPIFEQGIVVLFDKDVNHLQEIPTIQLHREYQMLLERREEAEKEVAYQPTFAK